MIKRSSGVFLNISSLPGDFGIGDFGNATKHFIEAFLDMGFHWWQVLPLTTIGTGNSPYSGISLRAGNYLYINPYKLQEEGLLNQEELDYIKYKGSQYLVNYEHAKWAKNYAIDKACQRFSHWQELKLFISDNEDWIIDYALFMCLKKDFNNLPWNEWNNEFRVYDKIVLQSYAKDNKNRLNYYYIEQFLFFKQWFGIKNMANSLGMGMIGDIPIYPRYDSVEVWSNHEEYLLDEDMNMICVAGVPPDYYAKEGQLWNNPVYNYDKMIDNKFKTIKDRINYALRIYDYARVDHFRGFYQYWAVPYGNKNAIDGKWYNGPKMQLFDSLKGKNIIAEDLGVMDNQVVSFLNKTKFPGMRVMQFGFLDDDSIHLPHNYPHNCVAYTSTHDNDTTLGWLFKLDEDKRNYVLNYCGIDIEDHGWGAGGGDCPATKSFIRTLIASTAKLAMVSFQDLCGYGSDTRMNIPGKPDGNWMYRATYGALSGVNTNFMQEINKIYGRNRPFDRL